MIAFECLEYLGVPRSSDWQATCRAYTIDKDGLQLLDEYLMAWAPVARLRNHS
jgi:hypothetical protein